MKEYNFFPSGMWEAAESHEVVEDEQLSAVPVFGGSTATPRSMNPIRRPSAPQLFLPDEQLPGVPVYGGITPTPRSINPTRRLSDPLPSLPGEQILGVPLHCRSTLTSRSNDSILRPSEPQHSLDSEPCGLEQRPLGIAVVPQPIPTINTQSHTHTHLLEIHNTRSKQDLRHTPEQLASSELRACSATLAGAKPQLQQLLLEGDEMMYVEQGEETVFQFEVTPDDIPYVGAHAGSSSETISVSEFPKRKVTNKPHKKKRKLKHCGPDDERDQLTKMLIVQNEIKNHLEKLVVSQSRIATSHERIADLFEMFLSTRRN